MSERKKSVPSLLRMLLVLVCVLLIPVLPFLAFGAQFEEAVRRWQESPMTQETTAIVAIGLLATDIFLPIPSSFVSTLVGVRLGWLVGGLVCWLGMTIGATIGFGLARSWGRPVARWFAKDSDLDALQPAAEKFGASVLVLTRAVPVLAEASVLLVGIHRISWRKFLPPVVLSNLGIALAYSAFGDFAGRNQWLPVALAIALAFPVFLGGLMHRILPRFSS